MAKKVTLKNLMTNEIIYPQILVESILNETDNILSNFMWMKENTTAFTSTADY